MKNVIKRGTSLLLVLAMLLSFAVVVGAEEPEKYLTLTAGSIVLYAGESKCLPVYEAVKEGYEVDSIGLSASSSDKNNVVVDGLYEGIPTEWTGKKWKFEKGIYTVLTDPDLDVGGEVPPVGPGGTPLLVWASNTGSFTTSDLPLCYVKVTAPANATPGVYQINLTSDPGVEEKSMFTVAPSEGGPSLAKTTDDAILNPGTVIVLPEGASLPTVILTKTAFEAPTQAGLADGGEAAGNYDLTKYVKLVTDTGLVDVTSLSVTMQGDKYVSLKQGNVLSLATTAEKDKGYKLTVTAANGSAFDPAVELPFTVSKQDSAFTMAGFTKNGGYSMDFAGPYEAPAYSGTTANTFVSLDPRAYDQYGMSMGQATTELELYSDAACSTEAITSGNAFESVTVAAGTGSVQISKNLQADVWCKVRASATIDGVTKTSDWITFQIKSNYPQAASATLELRGMDGKPFSVPMTTIAIPWGTIPTNTYTVHVSDFRQANGETMPEGTAPSATDVTIALDGTYTGVSINGNKLVIDKTAQAGTVTVKAMLNGKTLGTLPLTLQKAASKVTELKLYDSATGKPKDGTKIEIKSGVTNGKATLPGIREGDELVLTFGPVCAIDQYGEIYQVEGKNFLRPSQYALYKQSSTNPEAYETCAVAERSVNAEGVVTATIKNSLKSDGTLLVQPGTYKFGTYDDNGLGSFNLNQKLMSDPFELVYGESEYNTLEVTADETSVKVPYAYGTTEQTTQQYLTLTVNAKDQYGKAIDASKITDLALDESTVWVGGNAIGGILPVAKDQLTTTASNVLRLEVKPSAGENMKTNLTADLEVTLTFKVDGVAKRIEKTKVTTLTKDASVLSCVSANIGDFSFFASTLDPSKTEATFNLTAPKDETKTYDVSIYTYDQYASNMSNQYAVTEPEDGSIKLANRKLTVTTAAANKELVISFPNAANPTWTVTIKVVPMEFMKSETGKNDTFQLSDYLTNDTFSAEYNGKLWSTILAKKDGAKVYIKTAEGNNTPIDDNKLSLEVTKDGTPVGMDAKANAGSYQVKLVYTDAEGQTYTVDEKTFTITPKTVKITVNGTITKEYDGTTNLPDVTLTVTAYETLNVDKSVLKFAQENVGTGINVELTSADANCLKTASGEPATNYTADLSELKGTITARQLTVTPKTKTFTYGQDTEITNALTTEFDYAGKNGTLPSGLTPTFNGSMVLTQNEEVKSTYNAGDYYPRQGTLAVNSNNYEISEFKTTVNGTEIKWVVSPKTVDPFDVTLQAEYGINGSELYAMLNTAKVTVDGKEVNLSTVYNVNVLDIEDAGKNKVSRTGTDAVNAGEYTVTNWTLTTLGKNYTFNKVPTLKIKVKPHVLTDADVQLSGETSAGFDGTKKTVTVTVSFTYNGRPVTLTKDTDYTITGEVEASNAGGHFLTVTAVPNGNLTGSVQKRWQIWSYEIQPGDLTFKLKSGVTFTYDTTPKKLQKSDVAWDVTATDAKRKAFLEKYFTEDDFNLDCLEQTDAGDYTASASLRHNFTKSQTSGAFNMNVSWTIGKSSEKPISDQTASTKYGQPGSAEITVSDGVKKGLDASDLSVLVLTDTNSIIKGTPSVTFENGKIIVNWQLQGDATTIDKTATLRVTVAETDNYKPYTFDVVVTATKKLPQTGFGFTTATNVSVGYAEDTYTNPVQNVKTTNGVEYRSDNETVATVNSDGVVTIKDVGEATIWARAREDATYAEAMVRYKLTVVRSTLTVTASSATMTANDSVPSFTASVTGLKRGQTTAQVFQTLSASAATDGKTAGTYAVNASATLKADFVPRYTLRFVPGTLTVNPAVTVIDTVLPIIIGGNTCANGYANCACESFYDLDASRWYHEAIDWAYNLGLMNGTTKSTFGPNAAATRAQTWTMLARIAGQDTRRSVTWYEVGQKWAMGLGITDGTNPMGSLTREQLAAMLYRYVGSPAVNGTLTFTDSANVSTWARNAMIWAVQNGILDGVGGNRLNPKGTTTRAQAAAIFMRFSKLINK